LDVKTQGKYLYIVDLIIKKDEATQQASIYVTKDGKLILLGEGGGIIEITEESDLQTSATSIEENVSQPPTINTGINISTAAYVSGPGDASITIIEFNDYQCPFCKRFRDETLDLIIDQYGDNIKYVLMDFPITSIHPQAFIAHIAARCAGEQNRYFEYHDKLFANQLLWSKFPPESEDEINELKKYAEELRLDKSRFDQCLDSKKYAEDILNNMQEGVNAGVTGTPAFFINGQIVRGAQPFRVFQQIIEAELAKK
jgi:protein-disulfide isomerase